MLPPASARTIRKRTYKNFVENDFIDDMKKVDWSDVYQCQDVHLAAEIFSRKFAEVLNHHAPWVIYQERKNYAPWLTDQTKELMIKRDNHKKKAEEFASAGDDTNASEYWSLFKQLRNKVNNKKKAEERNYKLGKIISSKDNPAALWATAKNFMNWQETGGPPTQLHIGGRLISKASLIASELNSFFITKVSRIREVINYLPNRFIKCQEIMVDKNCKLGLKHITIKKINKLLKGLKNSKSISIDELDNFSVKAAADVIDKPLHHIVTLSLMQNSFPRFWKLSKVIPLHKKECKLNMKNYRPVAILSPLSKILEKVIYEQLYDYFTRNQIFHPNLRGYRQNRSTQTALLTMYDRWVKAAAAGQVSGAVLLDLSAAFDLVDPELLISKLRIYGLEEDFICWISSYLSDRYQAVWLDHVLSDFLHCEVGVPQGSILGPLLFLIFFNDLPATLESSVDSYADDTTVTASGKTVQEISSILTRDCSKVSDWMRSNKLKINPDKTHLLTLGTTERLRNLSEKVVVKMDGITLDEDEENSELLLGCHIQANSKWKKQVQVTVNKLKKKISWTH